MADTTAQNLVHLMALGMARMMVHRLAHVMVHLMAYHSAGRME